MPRQCIVCARYDRVKIEARIVSGDSISRIASEISASPSAVYRHVDSHLSPELRASVRTTSFDSTALIERVAEIADDARAARKAAYGVGSIAGATRAGDSELRALTALLDRLGIDDTAVIDQLREGEALARAVGNLVRLQPQVMEVIALELDRLHAGDMASALRAAAPSTTTEGKSIKS